MTKTNFKALLLASVIVLVALAAFFYLRSITKEDDETETVYCGANNTLPTKVFKNPTKAFPSFVKEFDAKINSSIALMDSIAKKPGVQGSGAVELNTEVIELREKLNQESARMEMIMKSNFLAYNSKPCDEQISKQYFDLLKLMAEKNAELEKLKADLTRPASKGGDTSKVVVDPDTNRVRAAVSRFSANYQFLQ